MILFSEIKHSLLLVIIISLIGILAFTIEKSEFTGISKIEIEGNVFLSAEQYLSYAKLIDYEGQKVNNSIIRDRLSKHPYIKNIDVTREERGIVKIKVFEKKIDAVLLNDSRQFLISDRGEILPFIFSTKNLDLPVIITPADNEITDVFKNASSSDKIFRALKIVSTAEIFDPFLHKSISEINLSGNNISIHLMNFTSPIFFGLDNEIEKTVYLSKIFKHLKLNKFDDYLKYVDLRFDELVYLGFDEQITNEKESI